MFRTFCEAMDQEPAMTLAILEECGYTSTRTDKLAARIRQDIEIYGDFNFEDALITCDLDQLTEAEIEDLERQLHS